MERRNVVDYRFLASIWATNDLAGIVISVKILGLKFMPYIADSAPRAHFKYKVCVTAQEMRVWPLGLGLQEQGPKHLKLRRLRAGVVSVEEKVPLDGISCESERRAQANH